MPTAAPPIPLHVETLHNDHSGLTVRATGDKVTVFNFAEEWLLKYPPRDNAQATVKRLNGNDWECIADRVAD